MPLVMRGIEVPTLPHTERWPTSSRSSTINRSKGTESTVKDRVQSDIGAGKPLQHWVTINWKQVKKRVRNLRQRIYRATQNQQYSSSYPCESRRQRPGGQFAPSSSRLPPTLTRDEQTGFRTAEGLSGLMGNCHESFLGEGDAATCSLLPDCLQVVTATG